MARTGWAWHSLVSGCVCVFEEIRWVVRAVPVVVAIGRAVVCLMCDCVRIRIGHGVSLTVFRCKTPH